MVPFVPFIALVGNAVSAPSASSREDVALLEAALAVMRPVAVDSPHVRIVFTECQTLIDTHNIRMA